MLQRHSAEAQALLETAELACERALQAQSSDDKQFWLEMEENGLRSCAARSNRAT